MRSVFEDTASGNGSSGGSTPPPATNQIKTNTMSKELYTTAVLWAIDKMTKLNNGTTSLSLEEIKSLALSIERYQIIEAVVETGDKSNSEQQLEIYGETYYNNRFIKNN